MADECTSRTPHNWWNYTIPSSWHIPNLTFNNNNSSSYDQDDGVSHISTTTSFTNLSGLVDHPVGAPPSYVFIGDNSSDTNLWKNVLVQDVKENYLDVVSSRSSLSISESGILDEHGGACDYLKKMDNTNAWELPNNSTNSSLSNVDKYFNLGFVDNNFTNNEGNRLGNKLSSLVCNSSSFDSQPFLISLNSSSFDHYLNNDDLCPNNIRPNRMSDLNGSYYDHDMNVNINDRDRDKIEPAMGSLTRGAFSDKYYGGLLDSSCTNGKGFEDNYKKPLVDFHACKPSNYKKQRPSYVTSLVKGKNNRRGEENSIEGSKKKRFEDNNSESVIKKPKQENSTASSIKMQPPKMKLGEKINALQQIVSPFGKTDTASVLLEAIEFIKCLQEQVQLLSSPYMKANINKDPWANMEWNERGDKRVDLKSKGLCLFPISSTPQIYRDNTGSDYWTPTYRGCSYR